MKYLFGAALALGLSAGVAEAATLGGEIVVANDGHVVATFLGGDASFDSELYLEGVMGRLFHNHLDMVGDTVDLGEQTAGTVLRFSLLVLNTGATFFSGPASGNPDGLAHALLDDLGGGVTYVGFEDIYGYTDADFNDLAFSFTNTKGVPSVPVPAAGLMLLAGLGAMGAFKRRG